MSIFSIVAREDIEKADLTLSANLVGNNGGKVGYGIARSNEKLTALVDGAFNFAHKHDIDDVQDMFDSGLGIMLVVTPAYRDNYTYECSAVMSAGDADPESAASDGSGCVEYLIRLKSIEQAGEDDAEAADYTDKPMQTALLLGVPPYATSVRVWVLPPDADDEEAEQLEPYTPAGGEPVKARPKTTPADVQRADLAHMPGGRRIIN